MNEDNDYQQESGSDSPVSKREDDHLDRWSTALEILNIVKNSPIEWSVRIGIFGKWGSGKTSVMRFTEEMAKTEGIITVRFNPWQYKTEQEMWLNFADEVYLRLKKAGFTVPEENKVRTKIKMAQWGGKVSDVASIISSTAETLGGPPLLTAGINGGIGLSSMFSISLGKEDFQDIAKVLDGQRIMVLIDDLDRTDASLVPRLLYGIHALLDLQGFCFILGFDPEVVGSALKTVHTGWDGLLFLEKIIDFPVWLPEPTENQLKRLLYAEKKKYCDWIPNDSLVQVFDKLPKNPRSLKRFIRFLWRLKTEVKRHNKQELNLALLIAINIFKAKYPTASCHIFRAPDVCKNMVSFHWRERLRKTSDNNIQIDNTKDLRVSVDEVLRSGDLDIDDRSKNAMIEELIWIGGFAANATSEIILYHANITENPHAFTWKEYDSFYSRYSTKKSAAVIVAIKRRAVEMGLNEGAVVREFFESICNKYTALLSEAADANTEIDRKKKIKEAKTHFKMLNILISEKSFFNPLSPALTANEFQILLSTAIHWAHFTKPNDYLPLRKQEENALISLAEKMTEIEECYELVDAEIRRSRFDEGLDKRNILKKTLSDIFETKAAEIIALMPAKASCVTYLKPTDKHQGFLKILFNQDSKLWKNKTLKKAFLTNLKSGKKNHLAIENAIDIFYLLSSVLTGHLYVGDGVKEKLIESPMVIKDFWEAVTAQQLQPRAVGSILQVLKDIERVTNINDFKKPKWLSDLEESRILKGDKALDESDS